MFLSIAVGISFDPSGSTLGAHFYYCFMGEEAVRVLRLNSGVRMRGALYDAGAGNVPPVSRFLTYHLKESLSVGFCP